MKSKIYAAIAAAVLTGSAAILLATPAAANQDVYYKNCDAVRAAGKAPLYRGEPGYRAPLDRDNDGIACEVPGSSGGSSPTSTPTSTKSPDRGGSSSNDSSDDDSYGQIGDDDVPAGGVAAGGG